MPRDLVDNAPLRAAVQRSGMALSEIDRQLGVSQHRTSRALGIGSSQGRGKNYHQRRIDYALACRIADVIGADPYEVGL